MGDLSGGVPELETTIELVRRARAGNDDAVEALCARYLAPLRRWARNRLPARARDLVDTDDIVQETLIKTVRNLGSFETMRDRGLHAYLRRALDNRIRDEAKRARRAMPLGEPPSDVADAAASPLERVLGAEAMRRYEQALENLSAEEREAVVARIEFGLEYKEIALAVGSPSPNAVRMTISRALARMAKELGRAD
jgi:RNA polymerase sigma-70 factor (ECF subfamily)